MNWKFLAFSFAALVLVFQGGMVNTANADNGPGCGLGKLAWQDYPNKKNIAPQVMMATTNGTFGSQTFGISSGTSGCTNDGHILTEHKVNVFASINFENLSQEMAQGHGEHLTSLATLMGVPVEQHPEFFAMTQAQYKSLVKSGAAAPTATIAALHDAMAKNPAFTQVAVNR